MKLVLTYYVLILLLFVSYDTNNTTLGFLFADCGSLISSMSSSATPSDGTNRDGSTRPPCTLTMPNLAALPGNDNACSLTELPPPYSLTPKTSSNNNTLPPSSTLVAVRTSSTACGPRTSGIGSHCAYGGRTTTNSASGDSTPGAASANGDVFVIGSGENGYVTG